MKMLDALRASVLGAVVLLILSSCDRRDFNRGPLNEADLVGDWDIAYIPRGVRKSSWEKSRFTLFADGKFDAFRYPLQLSQLRAIDGPGKWRLENVSKEGSRVFWELDLHFTKENWHVRMQIAKEKDELSLLMLYDVDTGESFKFLRKEESK